jgi:aspartyl protease family protein
MSAICQVHEDGPVATCSGCKRPVCAFCATPSQEGPVCWLCQVVARKARGRKQAAIVGGVVAVGVGGLVAFGMMGSKSDAKQDDVAKALAMAPPPQAAPAPYHHAPNQIRVLRDDLKKEPCNRRAALDLAELLNENEAFGETIELDEGFVAKCGAFPRLLWTDVYAHEQRSEWAQAATAATTLIEDDPTDSDFWWWRGQDRMEEGKLDLAGADFRQSMAEGGHEFAAFRFIPVAEKLKTPCEAAFALRQFIFQDEDAIGGSVISRYNQLYASGSCDAVAGKGKASVKVEPGMDLVMTKASLKTGAATEGSFVIDTKAAFVVVSKAFADKAKLAVDGAPEVTTLVLGDLKKARVLTAASLSVGGATAANVQVAVVDELPKEMDGVIGESFLWRFAYVRDDVKKKATFAEWKTAPIHPAPVDQD